MLTRELRYLEAQKIINRKIFAEITPRVEYSLRKKGEIFFLFLKNLANGVVSILKIRAQFLKRCNIELLLEMTKVLPVHLVNI